MREETRYDRECLIAKADKMVSYGNRPVSYGDGCGMRWDGTKFDLLRLNSKRSRKNRLHFPKQPVL